MEAQIMVAGNVGNNVEWHEDERYEGRASFSLGVTPSVFRDGRWQEEATTWYRVTCWRRLAVHVRDSIRKGDAVVLGGKLRLDRWVDQNNVQKYEYAIDAKWVGHDLRRGSALFERARIRQDPSAPNESDADAARAEYEARQFEAMMVEEGFDEGEAVDPATGEVTTLG
ncbi:single-stranded DNA-binding protein [Propioniciclava sp. MC1595]|uniref:single-stranded DNA-binding protein n=1 Tax=Propioniciclava sp. MC1595 TaxID=2760308 RepID=UPI00166242DB|nr:single-stranded DNA-binding protein [Propioniciclava sp. MC1595]MBB1493758.1 single-stranded DNA-binding protein [Propioniciclava sp. MC1595]QTE25039.1 single-stranded DNA-binding protein [Propioniciclava sp. MC1595]